MDSHALGHSAAQRRQGGGLDDRAWARGALVIVAHTTIGAVARRAFANHEPGFWQCFYGQPLASDGGDFRAALAESQGLMVGGR